MGQLEYWVIDADLGESIGPLDTIGYGDYLKSHSLPSVALEKTSYYDPPSDYSPQMRSWLQKSCQPV